MCISEGNCIAQKCCHSPFLQLWIYGFLMPFRSITEANDVLDEFNVKMTLSKSGTTCKILQYLAEPSKVLQKCCSSFKFLWNWTNTVNLCSALKTESLFSLVFYFLTYTLFNFLGCIWSLHYVLAVYLLWHFFCLYISYFIRIHLHSFCILK